MTNKQEGAAPDNEPRPQENSETQKKNTAKGDVGQGKTTNDAKQKTRKRFAMIPECAAACPGLEVFDYRVLIAIGCHVNGKDRIARVSQATICRTMGLKAGNRTRVRESVKRLVGAGLLKVINHGGSAKGHSAEYRIPDVPRAREKHRPAIDPEIRKRSDEMEDELKRKEQAAAKRTRTDDSQPVQLGNLVPNALDENCKIDPSNETPESRVTKGVTGKPDLTTSGASTSPASDDYSHTDLLQSTYTDNPEASFQGEEVFKDAERMAEIIAKAKAGKLKEVQ